MLPISGQKNAIGPNMTSENSICSSNATTTSIFVFKFCGIAVGLID
jgi:hypothetical protein